MAGAKWDRGMVMQVLLQRDTQVQQALTYFPEAQSLLRKFAAHYNSKEAR